MAIAQHKVKQVQDGNSLYDYDYNEETFLDK